MRRAAADEVLTVERARNLRRLAAYDRRAAAHGLDYDDRDRRAQRGRAVIADISRRIPRHRSLVVYQPR